MKELCLHAFFDGSASGVGRQDVCRWLALLAGMPETVGMPLPARLLCDDSADAIEIWLPVSDDCGGVPGGSSAEGVAVYRRVLLRPARGSGEDGEWRVGVELPADVGVCRHLPLSELLMTGSVPQRVVMDGRVFPFGNLTMEQMRRMDEGRAVLTPQLVRTLGLKCPVGKRMAYAELHREVERRLCACFPGGGEAEGCPLHVDLRLPDVPAGRIFRVPAEQFRLRFGQQGEAALPREGLERYGAFGVSPCRLLTVVMLYPEGRLEDARRLFRLLFPMAGLIGAVPSGKEDEWLAYRTDGKAGDSSGDSAVDGLVSALYAMQARVCGVAGGSVGSFAGVLMSGPACGLAGRPGGNRLYCYIPPEGSWEEPLRGEKTLHREESLRWAALSVRLRRLVRLFGSLFLGPVPLHGIGAEALGWRLPSLAADLLVQMGGVPWVAAGAEEHGGVLFAGLSCSGFRQGGEVFCAGGFWQPSLLRCQDEVCCPSRRFGFFFGHSFRMACERFARRHEGELPDKVLIYCHPDFPQGVLRDVAAELGRYLPAVPVALARVRSMAGAPPCCYDPGADGCMPPAGTCLHMGGGRMLLFCRGALPALGKRGVF